MANNEVILRFDNVSFEYGVNKPILDEVSFPIRRGSKTTVMGQNGAGKSTIFGLITGSLKPESGSIFTQQDLLIATARQVIKREDLNLTVREFFESCFDKASFAKASAGRGKIYDLDPKIDEVLEVVNLKGHKDVHERILRSFSGGQQARILLASALIQDPDLLLLDEPTNNLDHAGITHLTDFLKNYKKTVVVISHDADFLNAFSDGVLYLDIYTRKIEQYAGNYKNVLNDITLRVERENSKNARLAKLALEKKEKANFFAMKGGRLRLLAKRMREDAAEMEEEQVDVRKEDKTIKHFNIPSQEDMIGEIINISSFSVIKNGKPVKKKANISMNKNRHLLLSGPNGIGKSTLLEALASGTANGAKIKPGIRAGYYRQDFSTLNFEDTVYDSLASVIVGDIDEHNLRSVAAGVLISSDIINSKIGKLSEGQKGLVAFAQLVLQKPGLLILDEPTNHINFRHLPVIASALDKYEGAMILVSHVPEFVEQIRIDETLDLAA